MTDKLLDGNEVDRIANGCDIIDYPNLKDYNSIEDLMGDKDKVILLYLNEKDGNTLSGHWCALTRYDNREKVCFFDSYGIMPDNQLKWHPEEKRIELEQTEPLLTRLLSDYADRGGHVEYNDMRYQDRDDDIATCGRHTALRCRFKEIPLETYNKMFKAARKKGADLDKLSVHLTEPLL